MKLIIKPVTKCRNCEYFRSVGVVKAVYVCVNQSLPNNQYPHKEIDDIEGIPDWCPLPNAQDFKGEEQ